MNTKAFVRQTVHERFAAVDPAAHHEAARGAWGRASTAAGVAIARDLSRAAAVAFCPSATWLEELDAACIDAEAEHAGDLHAQTINLLRATCVEP